jgi:hypothetical protein
MNYFSLFKLFLTPGFSITLVNAALQRAVARCDAYCTPPMQLLASRLILLLQRDGTSNKKMNKFLAVAVIQVIGNSRSMPVIY